MRHEYDGLQARQGRGVARFICFDKGGATEQDRSRCGVSQRRGGLDGQRSFMFLLVQFSRSRIAKQRRAIQEEQLYACARGDAVCEPESMLTLSRTV